MYPEPLLTKMNVAKVRAKPKTIHASDVNASATLPRRCCWSGKLVVLYEAHHHVQQTYMMMMNFRSWHKIH